MCEESNLSVSFLTKNKYIKPNLKIRFMKKKIPNTGNSIKNVIETSDKFNHCICIV